MKEKEKCVSCWKDTDYNKDTSISKRQFYIETVGQLCEDCHNAIYGKDTKVEVIESKDYIIK